MSTKDTNRWMFSTLWNPTNFQPLIFWGSVFDPWFPQKIPIRPQAPMKHGINMGWHSWHSTLKNLWSGVHSISLIITHWITPSKSIGTITKLAFQSLLIPFMAFHGHKRHELWDWPIAYDEHVGIYCTPPLGCTRRANRKKTKSCREIKKQFAPWTSCNNDHFTCSNRYFQI